MSLCFYLLARVPKFNIVSCRSFSQKSIRFPHKLSWREIFSYDQLRSNDFLGTSRENLRRKSFILWDLQTLRHKTSIQNHFEYNVLAVFPLYELSSHRYYSVCYSIDEHGNGCH